MIIEFQGHEINLDEEDQDLLGAGTWNVCDCAGYLYLMKSGGVPFHRIITNAPVNSIVDHINKNTLDNRKENLRLVTKSENGQNSKQRGGTSQYRGVFKRGDKYRAYINCKSARIYLGSTSSETVAAMRYDAAAIYLYGRYAALNFPDDREIYLNQVEGMEE